MGRGGGIHAWDISNRGDAGHKDGGGMRDGKGEAGGGGRETGRGGRRSSGRIRMNRYDVAGIACAVAASLTYLVITLVAFGHISEPWRTAAWTAAFIAAFLTVATFGVNMFWAKRQEARMDAMERRNAARFDEILKAQEETNRLLRMLVDKSA